jgi:thioredoxin reductase (NADPH)
MDSMERGYPRGPEYSGGEVYDVAIIGAGPAGLTAAIYSGRAMLKTLLIEKLGAGGQAALTDNIENYPGFPEGIVGFDLTAKMKEQAKKFGVGWEYGVVESMTKDEKTMFFTIKTDSQEYRAKSVIVTTGVSPKRLGVPGEDDLIGKGIFLLRDLRRGVLPP